MRKNPSPFFSLPTLQKKAEMRDILKQDVRRLLGHEGTQTIKLFCTQKVQL